MMRIVRVKLRYFKLLTSRAHQIRIQSLLSNYFGTLYLDGENLFLTKIARTRDNVRIRVFDFLHPQTRMLGVRLFSAALL